MELMHASRQWASRPADERFTSLLDLQRHTGNIREHSIGGAVSTKRIEFAPKQGDEMKGLQVAVKDNVMDLTHWSFGQASALARCPAGFLRTIPAPLAADCLNYGIKFLRDTEDVGTLRFEPGMVDPTLTAATGPNYGRVWNSEIVDALVGRFGDGVSGDWKVPGEWKKDVPVTKENTTLFASDRDMFVFLCDEKNRIEMDDRRNGAKGSLARGFFIWNSEVGDGSLGAAFFLFDEVCQNRIVWGAQDYKEIRIRHTSGAPDRWLGEITPVLVEYANASAKGVQETIKAAQDKKLGDDLDKFMSNRFTAKLGTLAKAAHEREEGRPIETVWDVVTGLTAHAKSINNNDERVKIEREAGKLLDLVAVK